MNAALKPPRQMVHRNTFPASKGDDEMFFSGTMAAHSKRRRSSVNKYRAFQKALTLTRDLQSLLLGVEQKC